MYVLEDVLFTVSAVACLRFRFGEPGLFAGISAAHVLTFMAIIAYIMIKNRGRIRRAEDLLMLRPGFGFDGDNEFEMTITDMAGVAAASAGIVDFCVGRGLDRKAAARLGLAAEEIAHNITQYGFADGKEHYIDLRAQYRESDGMVLIVRDNCRLFNPKERYQYLAESDKMTNFGLRIVMNLARDVQYTSAMKLNNLLIRI